MAFGSGAGDYDDERLTPRTYALPELAWETIAGRLEPITISLLRFDARLEASGLSAGWQSRCDMTETVRALLLDGHLVIRAISSCTMLAWARHPTHEFTRAAAALCTGRPTQFPKAGRPQ